MTISFIIILVLILFSLGIFAFLRWKDKQRENEQPSEPVSNQEPTTEPEKPVEPKFKAGDWICNDACLSHITSIENGMYYFDEGDGLDITFVDRYYHLWTISDAKDGDVMYSPNTYNTLDCIFIYKEIAGNYLKNHCHIVLYKNKWGFEISDNGVISDINIAQPATIEQSDLLFAKMAEAGYTWDTDTNTLSKIEEPKTCMYANDNYTEEERKTLCDGCDETCEYRPAPEPEPTPEPVGTEEPTPEETFEKNLDELLSYFSQVVPIGEKTKNYILNLEAPTIDKDCFPVIYDYFGTQDNKLAGAQGWAWVVGLILSELVPEKREELMVLAYNFMIKGKDQPTYGFAFNSDPNIMRMTAAVIYAVNRDASIIPELRKEVGGKMLTYKNDISECYIDTTKFMPTAPAPYLSQYSKRPEGTPVDGENTAYIDGQIHDYISQYYSLNTKDKEKRQRTIQAISDKEYKKPHLFGKSRTVTDQKYGTMTFNPVFGKHNIGIEIPDDGVIAEMCYSLGKPCSYTRESLLNQEYGRRRPGEGETDGKANTDPKQRVLVNYAIEEGDGRTTGYYNKNGVYVDNNGVSIGDYETYFQNQVYANSYPSGHSAYIMGVGLILMMIMPERADKILKAVNGYTNSRMICRFHWQSDTIHGRVIGTMMVPVLAATTNVDFDNLLNKAKEEYQRILSGDVTPEPTPEPTEKVNTSLAYAIGGYGSCHVDAGEKQMVHRCTKQCAKERHPAIQVNQRVEFTIEGGGVTTDDGKTSGIWEANKAYGIKCPAVKEDVIATITMRNENGVRILKYRLSKDGTHDDGAGEI